MPKHTQPLQESNPSTVYLNNNTGGVESQTTESQTRLFALPLQYLTQDLEQHQHRIPQHDAGNFRQLHLHTCLVIDKGFQPELLAAI